MISETSPSSGVLPAEPPSQCSQNPVDSEQSRVQIGTPISAEQPLTGREPGYDVTEMVVEPGVHRDAPVVLPVVSLSAKPTKPRIRYRYIRIVLPRDTATEIESLALASGLTPNAFMSTAIKLGANELSMRLKPS